MPRFCALARRTLCLAVLFVSAAAAAQTSSNHAPQIAGDPPISVRARTYYTFRPWVRDLDGDPLTFRIANKPSWAQFNTAVGRLTGTPKAAGEWRNIRISVSDGRTTVQLAPFNLQVLPESPTPVALPVTPGSALLSWSVPYTNTDGSTLANLSGYLIHYGLQPDCLSQSVMVSNPTVSTHVFENLPPATYYFAVRALTTGGSVSSLSNVISQSVR